MARRKRRWLWPGVVGLAFFGWYLYHAEDWLRLAALLVVVVCVLAFWILFFKPAYCDVITSTRGTPCHNTVKGRLRGCRYHKREKRAALCARFGLGGNVAGSAGFGRRMPRAPQPAAPGKRDAEPETTARVTVAKPAYDTITLISGVLGTIAGVVGTAFTVIGFFLR